MATKAHGTSTAERDRSAADAELKDLLREVVAFHNKIERNLAEALSGHPVEILLAAAECYSLVDHRVSAADQSIGEFAEGYAEVHRRPYDAAAYALAVMSGQDEVHDRIVGRIGAAMDALPPSLRRLPDARATEVWLGIDEVQATAKIGIGLRFAGGEDATLLAILDPEVLGYVMEFEVVAESPSSVAERWCGDNPGCDLLEISAADARARIEEGIRMTIKRPDHLSGWPRWLVFIDWVLGLLPEGGQAMPAPKLRTVDDVSIVHAFLRSEDGAPHRNDPDSESIALACVEWHGMWADPLRWSTAAVTQFLFAQVPRWSPLGREYVIKVPSVLAALIRYGHGIRGVSEERTAETMELIERCTPELTARLDATPENRTAQRILELLDAESPFQVDWHRAS